MTGMRADRRMVILGLPATLTGAVLAVIAVTQALRSDDLSDLPYIGLFVVLALMYAPLGERSARRRMNKAVEISASDLAGAPPYGRRRHLVTQIAPFLLVIALVVSGAFGGSLLSLPHLAGIVLGAGVAALIESRRTRSYGEQRGLIYYYIRRSRPSWSPRARLVAVPDPLPARWPQRTPSLWERWGLDTHDDPTIGGALNE